MFFEIKKLADQGDRSSRSGGQVVDRFERGSESEVKATSVSYLVGARQFPKDPSISYMQQHRSIH